MPVHGKKSPVLVVALAALAGALTLDVPERAAAARFAMRDRRPA